MGREDDSLLLRNASVKSTLVNMGGGNDFVSVIPLSSIDDGTIDGGSGDNRLVRQGRIARGVAVRNFRA